MRLDFIVYRRKKLGYSQAVMAEKLGFANASVYCKYERGEYKFNGDILPKLAKILKCKISAFFN